MDLNEMLNLDAFQAFESDKLGNNLFINDPDRADRLYEYAAEGLDGSTHAEVINDWRDFLNYCSDKLEISDAEFDALHKEIDDCENWHEKNGSLWEIIG